MRMDKLTSQFQKALADAQSLALGRDHQFIEPLHLLTAMLAQDGAGVGSLLARAGVAVDRLRADLGKALERLPRVEGTGGDVQLSQALGRLLNLADKYAQKRGDDFIASEMFLLAVVEVLQKSDKLLLIVQQVVEVEQEQQQVFQPLL